ncbi:MAG: TIM barrel protein, partial [Novosphingobium sp.]
MNRPLALHQITAMEASPAELVSIAAEAGCQSVCIFTHIPAVALPDGSESAPFPLVTQDNVAEVKERLQATGIKVENIEYFPVAPDGAIEDFRKGFQLGAELGARRAVVHIHDADDARAVDTLGRLADLAAEYDLSIGLEFMGITPACNSIQRAAWFVDQADRP